MTQLMEHRTADRHRRRFRPRRRGQRGGRGGASRRHPDLRQPDGRRAGRGRRGGARAAAAGAARSGCIWCWSTARRCCRRRELPALVGADGRFDDNQVRAGSALFLAGRGAAPARRRDPRPVRGVPRDRARARPRQRAPAHAPASDGRAADRRDRPRLRDAGGAPAARAGRGVAPRLSRRTLPRPRRIGRRVAALRRRLRRAGLSSNDQVFGIAWSGAMVEERVLGLLPHLPPGVSEIYCHPATRQTPALAAAMPGYRHAEELGALLSPAVRAADRRARDQPGRLRRSRLACHRG